MDWISAKDWIPADGVVVETKIDDENGVRNVQKLKRGWGRWLLPDGSMYVYYEPTHWRPAI